MNHIKINILGFSLTALGNCLAGIILPLLVLGLVAEQQKNFYLGLLIFSGLLLAMLIQPLAGALSDCSRFRWGRRRPFIFAGIAPMLLIVPSIGLIETYAALFLIYCLLQISSNVAQASWQGLIPDLVPETKRGLASGVKGLIEILGAIIGIQVIGYLVSERFGGGPEVGLWISLGVLALFLLIALLVTVLTVKERPAAVYPQQSLKQNLSEAFKIDTRSTPGFVPFLLSRFLFLMPLIMLRTFGLYFLRDMVQVEDPVTAVANLTVIIGICLLIAAYPAGRLADSIGRRPIVIGSGILGVVAIFMLLLGDYTLVLVAAGLLGIANGGFMSANWAMATDLAGKGEEARYLGIANLATAGASATAGLSGIVVDFVNRFSPGSGYQVVLIIGLVFFVVSSMWMIRVKTR